MFVTHCAGCVSGLVSCAGVTRRWGLLSHITKCSQVDDLVQNVSRSSCLLMHAAVLCSKIIAIIMILEVLNVRACMQHLKDGLIQQLLVCH